MLNNAYNLTVLLTNTHSTMLAYGGGGGGGGGALLT